VGFWELAEDFAYSPLTAQFDAGVTAAVQGFRSPSMTFAMTAITITGGTLLVTLVTLVLVGTLLFRGRRFEAAFAALAVGVGMLLSTLAKGHFERPRPLAAQALAELPSTYSFPSGHSMASLCVATVLAWLVLRSTWPPLAKGVAVAACVMYAVAVGVSRVYLAVHYPSDVIASWLLGGAWLALAVGLAAGWHAGPESPGNRQ
jgi:undecaprenyl-diphosphatase